MPFQHTRVEDGVLVLQAEIAVARARERGLADLAAHAHARKRRLDLPLQRKGELGNGELRDVADGAVGRVDSMGGATPARRCGRADPSTAAACVRRDERCSEPSAVATISRSAGSSCSRADRLAAMPIMPSMRTSRTPSRRTSARQSADRLDNQTCPCGSSMREFPERNGRHIALLLRAIACIDGNAAARPPRARRILDRPDQRVGVQNDAHSFSASQSSSRRLVQITHAS